jgi:integrase
MLRLAHEWREIQRVPRIRLLTGERVRDFVLSRKQEALYLAACPQPLNNLAVLMLETGLRIGEALHLEWADVTLAPVNGARLGYLRVREGKSKNARRVIPLTDRAAAMLRERITAKESKIVFANREGKAYLGTSINHLHRKAVAPTVEGKRRELFPVDFVLHSLRHTMLTRLGESGVDAFHHADCWTQQHCGVPTLHSSHPGGCGARFRAPPTVRRFRRHRAETTATRYSIRYIGYAIARKLL